MNINLEKDDITTILDALETYQMDIEHWENCKTISIKQKTTAAHVGNLVNRLNNILENN